MLLSMSVRTLERNFRVPIASHFGFYFDAVLAGCPGFLCRASTMHRHALHIHVDHKIDIANIDKLAVGVAKLNQEIVVAFLKSRSEEHTSELQSRADLGCW